MAASQLNITTEQYYELIAFIVTSAYLMYQGEQYEELYPSIRLMDIASRLTNYLIKNDSFDCESWPQEFLEHLDECFSTLEKDKQGFIDFMENSMLEVATKIKALNEQI